MRVRCSPVTQHLYIKKLVTCMGSSMPPRLRHAALRAAHSLQEVLARIDVVDIDDADIFLTNFSPAILTAVRPQLGATYTDNGPDRPFHPDRDLCYLELIFALARNSYWHPHLYCQFDHAIRMIAVCCESHEPHAFYLVGIFLRMISEQRSAASLTSITEQQWWGMVFSPPHNQQHTLYRITSHSCGKNKEAHGHRFKISPRAAHQQCGCSYRKARKARFTRRERGGHRRFEGVEKYSQRQA
ncbi:hypothetical protein BD769DRAFT_1513351 [Suillus cothurnatus]|nr:hypothetical protein BD769DRAFT_1513351 [Suillus cothurnatus]